MGELLLCDGILADIPFYIENVSLNIYSLEELCYYLEQNTFFLEPDFMSEDLCSWIETEAGNQDLARRLRTIRNANGSLQEFVSAILEETAFCSGERIQEIREELRETTDKTGYECQKLRADRWMKNQRYASAVAEYQSLLQERDIPPDFQGDVWHNLGTAYARLFFWEEAGECYRRAYELNQRSESLRAWLFVCRCMQDDEEFQRVVREHFLDEEAADALREELTRASRDEAVLACERELSELFFLKKCGKETEFEDGFSKMLEEWKNDYRRICR